MCRAEESLDHFGADVPEAVADHCGLPIDVSSIPGTWVIDPAAQNLRRSRS
jgi:hypothetical protein